MWLFDLFWYDLVKIYEEQIVLWYQKINKSFWIFLYDHRWSFWVFRCKTVWLWSKITIVYLRMINIRKNYLYLVISKLYIHADGERFLLICNFQFKWNKKNKTDCSQITFSSVDVRFRRCEIFKIFGFCSIPIKWEKFSRWSFRKHSRVKFTPISQEKKVTSFDAEFWERRIYASSR